MSTQPDDLDTSQIKNWRSIVTLVVFVLTSKLCYYQGMMLPIDSFTP
jgi:hypothetical protein